MTEGQRTCGSGGPVTPTFCAGKKLAKLSTEITKNKQTNKQTNPNLNLVFSGIYKRKQGKKSRNKLSFEISYIIL